MSNRDEVVLNLVNPVKDYAMAAALECRNEADKFVKRLAFLSPFNFLTIGVASGLSMAGGAAILNIPDLPYLGAGLALAGGVLALFHKALRCDEYQGELKTTLSQYRALATKYDQAVRAESEDRARILVGVADERRHELESSRRTSF